LVHDGIFIKTKRLETMKKILAVLTLLAIGMTAGYWLANSQAARASEGYLLEHDTEVAKPGPAPHKGPGRSTGYSFFEKAADFKQVFRKRVLHPGAAIGYHPQKEDEVYYILSGTGVMQMNGKEFPVKPGDAILTRPGSSHGLKQTGKDDLALIIVYEK
jgi:mannose-6-phosphate isomerase-like protein (cupin superfamily)